MHQALKAYFDGVKAGRPPDEETVIACFLDEFGKAVIAEDEQRRRYEEDGARQLGHFLRSPLALPQGEILANEKQFIVTIGGATVRGRIDRLEKTADGQSKIIDYKTGRAKTGRRRRQQYSAFHLRSGLQGRTATSGSWCLSISRMAPPSRPPAPPPIYLRPSAKWRTWPPGSRTASSRRDPAPTAASATIRRICPEQEEIISDMPAPDFADATQPSLPVSRLIASVPTCVTKNEGDACASPRLVQKHVSAFFLRGLLGRLLCSLLFSCHVSILPFPFFMELCDITSSQFVLCIESVKRIVKQKTRARVCIWSTRRMRSAPDRRYKLQRIATQRHLRSTRRYACNPHKHWSFQHSQNRRRSAHRAMRAPSFRDEGCFATRREARTSIQKFRSSNMRATAFVAVRCSKDDRGEQHAGEHGAASCAANCSCRYPRKMNLLAEAGGGAQQKPDAEFESRVRCQEPELAAHGVDLLRLVEVHQLALLPPARPARNAQKTRRRISTSRKKSSKLAQRPPISSRRLKRLRMPSQMIAGAGSTPTPCPTDIAATCCRARPADGPGCYPPIETSSNTAITSAVCHHGASSRRSSAEAQADFSGICGSRPTAPHLIMFVGFYF